MVDKLKFGVALLFVALGVMGFYLLAEQPMILRVLSVLAGIGAGVTVAWFTEPGRKFIVFGQEAINEARKVAWPSRKESMQMTGAVFAFVLVMAIVLWVTDKTLEWLLYSVILGWK
ncbi:MAG TPA: preprotein translocase subunit SecE [Rhodocyclaceae bacterium]